MDDSRKTKAHLIEELRQLRRRVESDDGNNADAAPSDAYYRTLWASLGIPTVLTDAETGTIRDANEAACALFGIEHTKLVGTHCAAHIRATGGAHDDAKKADETAYIVRSDAVHVPVLRYTTPVTHNGTPCCLESFVDVSAHKATEAALRESESRFRATMDKIDDGYYEVDLAGNFTFFNNALLALSGYTAEDLMGMNNRTYMTPATAERAFAAYNKVYRTGTAVTSFDWVFIRKNGEKRHVESSITLIRDRKGRATGFRGIVRDQTIKRLADEATRKAAALLETMTDGVALIAPDSTILEINRAALEKAGRTRDEVVGKPAFEFFEESDLNSFFDKLEALDSGTSHIESEFVFRRKDGSLFEARVAASLLTDADDRLVGILGIFKDISDQKKKESDRESIQAQLMQAQKMEAIGLLAGGVAHDFNNMLTAILGNAELAMLRIDEHHELYKYLSQISTVSLYAADLTSKLLIFSRQQPTEPTLLNLTTTITGMLDMVSRLIGEDITIETALDPHLWTVRADPSNMEQVMMNLIINARDALPEGGAIRVTAENVTLDGPACRTMHESRTGTFIKVTVSDTGIGMSPETVSKIFEPFFTTKKAGKGTGLGLSTVYGIVKQHEGWICVESVVDKGSTFSLYLPALPARVAEVLTPAEGTADLTGTGEHILLVEDEKDVRSFVKSALIENGYRVTDVASAEAALKLLAEKDVAVDLLFTDVVLPNMSGPDLFKEASRRIPGLPVLFSSGYADGKSHGTVIRKQGHPYLQKPYALSALLSQVRLAMEKKKAPKTPKKTQAKRKTKAKAKAKKGN